MALNKISNGAVSAPAAAGYPTQTIYPGHHDLLLGRGGETNNHSGNIKFRWLIEEYKPAYQSAPKGQKPELAQMLVNHWRALDPPGRFLSKSPHDEELWIDIGDPAARRRCSKSLGERSKRSIVADPPPLLPGMNHANQSYITQAQAQSQAQTPRPAKKKRKRKQQQQQECSSQSSKVPRGTNVTNHLPLHLSSLKSAPAPVNATDSIPASTSNATDMTWEQKFQAAFAANKLAAAANNALNTDNLTAMQRQPNNDSCTSNSNQDHNAKFSTVTSERLFGSIARRPAHKKNDDERTKYNSNASTTATATATVPTTTTAALGATFLRNIAANNTSAAGGGTKTKSTKKSGSILSSFSFDDQLVSNASTGQSQASITSQLSKFLSNNAANNTEDGIGGESLKISSSILDSFKVDPQFHDSNTSANQSQLSKFLSDNATCSTVEDGTGGESLKSRSSILDSFKCEQQFHASDQNQNEGSITSQLLKFVAPEGMSSTDGNSLSWNLTQLTNAAVQMQRPQTPHTHIATGGMRAHLHQLQQHLQAQQQQEVQVHPVCNHPNLSGVVMVDQIPTAAELAGDIFPSDCSSTEGEGVQVFSSS